MKISVNKDSTSLAKGFEPFEVGENLIDVKILQEHNWSPGIYKDNHRRKDNFLEAESIALDFDSGLSLEDAFNRFKDYWCIIGTTRNHQKDKGGITCDRFRVILKLEKSCTKVEEAEAIYKQLLEWNPEADGQTKDAARLFYPCRIVKTQFGGARIKMNDKLHNVRKYLEKAGPCIINSRGDEHLRDVCNLMAAKFPLTEDETFEVISEWNKLNIPPWNDYELKSKIRNSRAKIVPVLAAPVLHQAVTNSLSSDERKSRAISVRAQRLSSRIQLLPRLRVYLFQNKLSIFGAASKSGKTTVTSNIVAFALKQEKKVLFLSNEMSTDDICDIIEPCYPELGQAWDDDRLTILDRDNGVLDLTNSEAVLNIIKSSMETYDLIIFDQISFLSIAPGMEKYKSYSKFVDDIASLQLRKAKCAHILITQQLKNDAKLLMAKQDPSTWELQPYLGECRDTIKPAMLGFIYQADYGTGEGHLKISGIRYTYSVNNSDVTTKWKYVDNGSLTRIDSLIEGGIE